MSNKREAKEKKRHLVHSEVFKRFIGAVYGDEFPSPTHIGFSPLSIREERGLALLGS